MTEIPTPTGSTRARVPAWALPPIYGAIGMLLLAAIPMLLTYLFSSRMRGVTAPSELLVATMVVMAAGAAGGLSFSLVGRRLMRIPFAGRPLAGTVAVFAYLCICIWLLPTASSFRIDWAVLGLSALFGTLIGVFLPDAASRPAPGVARASPLILCGIATCLTVMEGMRAYGALSAGEPVGFGRWIMLALLAVASAVNWYHFLSGAWRRPVDTSAA